MIKAIFGCFAFILAGVLSSPSQAETSSFAVFSDRIFSNGALVNGGALFGNTPAEATFNPGAIGLFDFGVDISGNTFMFDVTSVTGPAVLSVRFINVTGFAVTEIAPGFFPGASPLDFVFNITNPGTFTLPSGVFSDECATIGGCNSVLVNATGANAFNVSVVSSAPEPSVWALMLIGFFGLAWRMKAARRANKFYVEAPLFAA